jgi:hypothetical protein
MAFLENMKINKKKGDVLRRNAFWEVIKVYMDR